MKLIIVESPTKANSIGQFLGSEYQVVASNGHIRDIRKDPFGVEVDNGFSVHWIFDEGAEERVSAIRAMAENADEVLLATDPDREGEAIAWHLCEVLGIEPSKKCRITYQEVTKSAVLKALQDPRPLDMDLVHAALCRSIIDYLVGFTVSPLLWKKYCSGLSAGRVQTAVLDMICRQEAQRKKDLEANANPTHWTISVIASKDGKQFGIEGKDRFETELSVNGAVNSLANGQITLFDIKESSVRESTPDAPFKTSTMMRSAMSHLGYDTTQTQRLAQDLFEKHHLITYMRTDAVFISEEFQKSTKDYIDKRFGTAYSLKNPRDYQARPDAQEAHEAIRPTDISVTPESVKSKLSSTEYGLYKLIYDRYLASQMSAAKSKSTSYLFESNRLAFSCSKNDFIFDGFRKVYRYGLKDNPDLPVMKKGDSVDLVDIKAVPHYKKSTPHFNQASLVEMMETCGIGRPSTYASTISILKERCYIEQEKKDLLPRPLGYEVNAGLQTGFPNMFNVIKAAEDKYESFTADMETRLDLIAKGEIDWQTVLRDFWNTFNPILEEADSRIPKWQPKYTKMYCPVCGGRLMHRLSKYGEFDGCDNYPACNYGYHEPEYTDEVCKKCGAQMVRRHRRNGTVFTVCSNPECTGHEEDQLEPLLAKPQRDWIRYISITLKPVSVTKFAKRIKKAATESGEIFTDKYTGDCVNKKFARYGYLELKEDRFGNKRYLPTMLGKVLGITTEDASRQAGSDDLMEKTVLGKSAQQFYINNLL